MKSLLKHPQIIFSYLAVLLLVLFGVLRLVTVFQSLNVFKSSMLDILIFKRNYSYDQKMQQLLGFEYVYIWHIAKNTQENDTIYFPQLPYAGIEKHIALYFLYPRQILEDDLNLKELSNEKDGGETYIALIDDFPNLEISTNKVVIFGDDFTTKDTVYDVKKYKSANFKGKYGLIKITK